MTLPELPSQRARRQELDRIERLGVTALTSPFTAKVVGVSFTDHYPDNLHRLNTRWTEAQEPLVVILVRNPANAFDASAIEVHVPALGEWAMIGHLAAPIAARMAPELDDGGHWDGYVVDVLIQPGHEDRPGISIHLQRVQEDHQDA
jgi:hypothetical protein